MAIETAIDVGLALDRMTLEQRAAVTDRTSPEYIPSECSEDGTGDNPDELDFFEVRFHHAHPFTDQPPPHRIGVAVNPDHTVSLHLAHPARAPCKRRNASDRAQSSGLRTPEALDRHLTGRAVRSAGRQSRGRDRSPVAVVRSYWRN